MPWLEWNECGDGEEAEKKSERRKGEWRKRK